MRNIIILVLITLATQHFSFGKNLENAIDFEEIASKLITKIEKDMNKNRDSRGDIIVGVTPLGKVDKKDISKQNYDAVKKIEHLLSESNIKLNYGYDDVRYEMYKALDDLNNNRSGYQKTIRVIDRNDMDAILKEQGLIRDGLFLFDWESIPKLGKLLGINYLVDLSSIDILYDVNYWDCFSLYPADFDIYVKVSCKILSIEGGYSTYVEAKFKLYEFDKPTIDITNVHYEEKRNENKDLLLSPIFYFKAKRATAFRSFLINYRLTEGLFNKEDSYDFLHSTPSNYKLSNKACSAFDVQISSSNKYNEYDKLTNNKLLGFYCEKWYSNKLKKHTYPSRWNILRPNPYNQRYVANKPISVFYVIKFTIYEFLIDDKTGESLANNELASKIFTNSINFY